MGIGFCGNFFNQETSFTFSPGEQRSFGTYTLTFQQMSRFRVRNSQQVGIEIAISKNHRLVGTLVPVKAYYPTSPQPMTEVAIRRSIVEDLYISLSSLNEDGSATIEVFINPLVNLVWASLLFFLVGILFSLSHKPVQFRKRHPSHSEPSPI